MHNTREKLIELVKRAITDWEHGDVSEKIADHLIANGVTVQEWIPVTERLPDEHTTVLIYDGESVYPSIFFCEDGFWTVDIYESDPICGVTHWMPLPEPPKEDKC